jgi:hypothetical protein
VRATRGEAAARLILLLATALTGACGLLSRQRDVYLDLNDALKLEDPDERQAALATLRGAEPLVPAVWLASLDAAGSPEASLEIIDRGLRFRPQSPDLLIARMQLLTTLGRRDDQIAAARATLATDAPAPLRSAALWLLVDGLLAQDRWEEAEAAVVRLAGLPFQAAEVPASAWARIALAHELAGRPDDADRTLAASLDLGPAGITLVRRASLPSPEIRAAANGLVQRAAAAQPDHPDLQLYLLVDRMADGDLTGAETALQSLPAPLPERLLPEREALQARVLLLQGRTDEGLALLRARLTEEPGDSYCLSVLLEAWHVRHVPEAAEVAYWLRASRRHLTDPALAAEVQSTLRELAMAEEQAPTETPAPEPPP